MHVLSLASRRSPVKRHLALLLNSLIPGSGLLLRHPGLWPAIPTVGGALGLSLLAVALVTNGSPTTIPLGWCGLTLWLVSVVAATWAWALMERHQRQQTPRPRFCRRQNHQLSRFFFCCRQLIGQIKTSNFTEQRLNRTQIA